MNVLIVVSKADPDAAILLGKKAAGLIRKNRISPLLLTETEFLNSADVFPMEYLDIRDSRKLAFGPDLTESLDITRANLRHQVEEEIRGSIGSLRRALLASRGKSARLKGFLKGWFGSQNALFRGLLRLKAEGELPGDPEEIASRLSDAFGVDADPLRDAARLRAGDKLDPAEAAKHLLLLLTELAGLVDAMGA